jgi:hypothetical protein
VKDEALGAGQDDSGVQPVGLLGEDVGDLRGGEATTLERLDLEGDLAGEAAEAEHLALLEVLAKDDEEAQPDQEQGEEGDGRECDDQSGAERPAARPDHACAFWRPPPPLAGSWSAVTSLYPTPQTVWMRASLAESLSRSQVTCTSTVRESP